MTGFVVFDYAARYPEAVAELAGWLRSGALRSMEHVVTGGIEKFPEALLELFAGKNFGKYVLAL